MHPISEQLDAAVSGSIRVVRPMSRAHIWLALVGLAMGSACKGRGDGQVGGDAPSICGDGAVDAGEECDQGPDNSDIVPDACRSDCRLARCGDGVRDSFEACDDGGESTAGCNATCTIPKCGDGVANPAANEPCDTAGESRWCDADCTPVECGDGVTNRSAGECEGGAVLTHGHCDGCHVVCDAQWGNCNANPDDGCELSLVADAENCGACGHSCRGGSCVDAMCKRIEVTSAAGTTSFGLWDSLVIDGAFVYWTSEGRILRAVREQSAPVVEVVMSGQSALAGLAVDGDTLFWLAPVGGMGSYLGIFTQQGGSTPRPLGGDTGEALSGLVKADGWVLWTDCGTAAGHYLDGRLLAMSIATGERQVVARGLSGPGMLTSTGTAHYWISPGTEAKAYTDGYVGMASGGNTQILSRDQTKLRRLAADDHGVYWTVEGTANIAQWTGTGTVMRFAPGYDRAARALATDQLLPGCIAASGGKVYWSAANELRFAPADGSDAPRRLITTPSGAIAMAADETYLYWVSGRNVVYKVAK